MVSLSHPQDPLNLETGYLCLDFANTAEWHASDSPDESLNSYHDLLEWAQGVGVLPTQTAEHLGRTAGERQIEANAVLDRAISLRETIYRIFSAIAHKNSPPAPDLARLNTMATEDRAAPGCCRNRRRLCLGMDRRREQIGPDVMAGGPLDCGPADVQ